MAKEYFVVTIIGPDRRGLVANITEKIVAQNANIEESYMTRLGGEFAVLMLLSLSNGERQTLLEGLEKLNADQVQVFVKETDLARLSVFEGFVPYKISVVGASRGAIPTRNKPSTAARQAGRVRRSTRRGYQRKTSDKITIRGNLIEECG